MSKQSDAKAAQGYVDKPVPSTRGNCQHLGVTRVLPDWEARRNREASAIGAQQRYTIQSHGVDKKLRCTIGNFAVKKMATCKDFAQKLLSA